MTQVCDGVKNCLDASDECTCLSYIRCTGYVPLQGKDSYNCPGWRKESCNNTEVDAEKSKLALYAVNNGSCLKGFEYHCNKSHVDNFRTRYTCENNDTYILQDLNGLCNGYQTCLDGSDEWNCPNIYRCKATNSTIAMTKLCDGRNDCEDYSDECQNCIASGIANDLGYIIANRFLQFYIIFESAAIIILNVVAICDHLSCEWQTKVKKVDKILNIMLSTYDLLLSVYLTGIVIKSMLTNEKYCEVDVSWRASLECNFLGVIFQISTFGSLQW